MGKLEADEVSAQNAEQAIRWGLFHRHLIGTGGSVYLDRLTLLTTPWFSIKLHRIYRPDRQRDLHDHPWNFLSVLLRGTYVEDTASGTRRCRLFNWKRAEDRHSIREVSRSPVWTLVFTGRRRRVWGFWVKTDLNLSNLFGSKERWVSWDEYEKLNEA